MKRAPRAPARTAAKQHAIARDRLRTVRGGDDLGIVVHVNPPELVQMQHNEHLVRL